MHLSAGQIRSINRNIARVNGIICGAPDKIVRVPPPSPKPTASLNLDSVIKIVAVPKDATF
jgi:hypothetical protein